MKKTLPSLLGSAALAAGCASAPQPVLVQVPYTMNTEPLVNQYPGNQTSYSRIAWNAGGALGPCIASETGAAPQPAGSRPGIAGTFNMNGTAAQQFAGLRTSARIFCGYNNPLAAGRSTVAAAEAQAAAFSNYVTLQTGEYLLADKSLQCRGEVVAVDPNSAAPGAKLPPMAYAVPSQFPNLSLPAGYAIPLAVVRDAYGHTMASSLSCEDAKTISRPAAISGYQPQ